MQKDRETKGMYAEKNQHRKTDQKTTKWAPFLSE